MSQFSQLIGSFERVGNFPLEKEYEFPSVEALHQWSGNDGNYATLYPGLKKLVRQGGALIEYWVVERTDEDGNSSLAFEPYKANTEEEEGYDIDIESSDYNPEEKEFYINFESKGRHWTESFPLDKVINSIENNFTRQIEDNKTIVTLMAEMASLREQMAILIAQGGGGGGDRIPLAFWELYFDDDKNKKTYIVDPSKLGEETSVDILLNWKINATLTSSDSITVYINGKEFQKLSGLETSCLLTGIDKNATITLLCESTTRSERLTSDPLKVIFGITVYTGGVSKSPEELTPVILTPSTDGNGQTVYKVELAPDQSSEPEPVGFSIPAIAFDVTSPDQLVLRDGNGFVLRGYQTEIETIDGMEYYRFKFDYIYNRNIIINISK